MVRSTIATIAFFAALTAVLTFARASDPPGEGGALHRDRITQEQIARGDARLDDIRIRGLRLFTTPFNRHDGYGDGAFDRDETALPGGRPTLQGNGTFLRVNGLDGQTCLECHSFVSAATSPPTLGIGGFGGSVTNAFIQPTAIDPADLEDLDGTARFDGRFANPPFVFGAGAVELLGLEMTADLQRLERRIEGVPDAEVDLVTKGVRFGTLRTDGNGVLDYGDVAGVDRDLVVKPFGRKGEFATLREFDTEAMQFHFGMQPVEVVGEGDPDDDGVPDEIHVGDVSALSIFVATLERPFMEPLTHAARRGFAAFRSVGCADCHRPELQTRRRRLPLRFPEVRDDPWANVYFALDLTRAPMKFSKVRRGGIRVPLFADLKRHDMGEGLKEDFARADGKRNREFTTARLWGIADSAPYLHDGRATTLTDAILLHGGEGEAARDAFAALPDDAQADLLAFLRSLRTPKSPAERLVRKAREASRKAAKRAKRVRRGDDDDSSD
jgi:hypothetical protein